ncbi:MAG: hypothetical protein ACP5KK_03035, partial [Candidatus Nanoarchaeia archaeon]
MGNCNKYFFFLCALLIVVSFFTSVHAIEQKNLTSNNTQIIPPQKVADALVVLNTGNGSETAKLVHFIREHGGVVSIVYPNSIVALKLPKNLDLLIEEKFDAKVFRDRVPETAKATPAALDFWNSQFEPKTKPLVEDFTFPNDFIIPKENLFERNLYNGVGILSPPGSSGFPPGWYLCYSHESHYAIGDVFVTIVLPESNGSVDPNLENWTSAQISKVNSEVGLALNWWVARSIKYNVSYPLTFWMYSESIVRNISEEPIIHEIGYMPSFVDEVLEQIMGVPGGQYVWNYFMRTNGTANGYGMRMDWAFVIGVANSWI